MKLFHAFPRPKYNKSVSGELQPEPPSDRSCQRGLETLQMILSHGLLCTPEKFKLYPNYNTENKVKQKFVTENRHHDKIIQSRACFTLVETDELSKEYKQSLNRESYYAHSDLFGEFAIGLDPLEARRLGVIPAIYYYKQDLVGADNDKTAGLASQIVERLDELRNVFAVLSYVEARAKPGQEITYPQPHNLEKMGIRIRFQSEIKETLDNLTDEEAELIYDLFNTDRVPSWNLVDFIEIMLSLFQTTDSTLEDAPLAFFSQREWRLVHHKTHVTKWASLGNHPPWRDEFAPEFVEDVNSVKTYIKEKNPNWEEQRFNDCWILMGTHNRHFRDFIREVVVPERYCDEVQSMINATEFTSKPPRIKPLPAKWR